MNFFRPIWDQKIDVKWQVLALSKTVILVKKYEFGYCTNLSKNNLWSYCFCNLSLLIKVIYSANVYWEPTLCPALIYCLAIHLCREESSIFWKLMFQSTETDRREVNKWIKIVSGGHKVLRRKIKQVRLWTIRRVICHSEKARLLFEIFLSHYYGKPKENPPRVSHFM